VVPERSPFLATAQGFTPTPDVRLDRPMLERPGTGLQRPLTNLILVLDRPPNMREVQRLRNQLDVVTA
jgi:hypothetical protein